MKTATTADVEAVERGASTLYESENEGSWDEASERIKRQYRGAATFVLEAALPDVLADERQKTEVQTKLSNKDELEAVSKEQFLVGKEEMHRQIATELGKLPYQIVWTATADSELAEINKGQKPTTRQRLVDREQIEEVLHRVKGEDG